MIKYGVIGAGKMGQNHIRNLKEIEGIDLIGYYDPVSKLSLKRYEDMMDLIKESDALSIVTPTSLHYETALKCLGKDVFIEKPLSPSIEECEHLKEKFKNNKLMVGQIERFSPVVQEIKKRIDEDELLSIEIHRCSPYDKRVEVSVIDDLMIHDIDLLFNYFSPSPIKTMSSTTKDVFSNEDYCQVIGEQENGVNFAITASRITQKKIRKICAHCKNSYIEGDLLNGTVKVDEQATAKENDEIRYENTSREAKIILMNNLKKELENFRDCIIYNLDPVTNVDEAIKNMNMIKKIKNR